MLKFMIASLPRSGSAWMANWLTTDKSMCFHDALSRDSLETLEKRTRRYTRYAGTPIGTPKYYGMIDTSLPFKQELFNSFKGKKLILTRNLDDINASLDTLGFPQLQLNNVVLDAVRLDYSQLFVTDIAEHVWKYLGMPGEFDRERHRFLVDMNVQNQASIEWTRDALRRTNAIP